MREGQGYDDVDDIIPVLHMQGKISSEPPVCVTRVTAPSITAQLNQCREKNVSKSTVRRRLCETGLYDRIAVKKHC